MNTQTLPRTKIRPPARWQAPGLDEVWRFRGLLLAFAARDIKLRYRQTALGIAWVVLQPILAAGVFTFVFGKVAKLDTTFLSAYTAMLGWNAFNTALTRTSGCLVQNSALISKVFFPRLVLPLSTLLPVLVDFAVALVVQALLMVFYKMPPTPAILLVPVWLALILIFATGCGLIAAALMVRYRDIQYIMPVLTMLLLYGSPVGYPASAVPEQYAALYSLNPLAGLLEAFRWSFLGEAVHWSGVLYSCACAIVALVAGVYTFKKMEREFADVI